MKGSVPKASSEEKAGERESRREGKAAERERQERGKGRREGKSGLQAKLASARGHISLPLCLFLEV